MMNKFTVFAFGTIFGMFITSILAYKFAERIVVKKQFIRNENRKRGTPVFWWGKRQGNFFIPSKEAAFTSKDDTFYQYPRKADLEQKPGALNDENYNEWFLEYIIYRNLTELEAWDEVQKDHPEFLPKKYGGDYKIQLKNTKKAFTEAMRRRKIKLGKST